MPQPNFKSRQIGFALGKIEAAGEPISGSSVWRFPTTAPGYMRTFSTSSLVVNRLPGSAAMRTVTFIGE
jgi:hypothetical protein